MIFFASLRIHTLPRARTHTHTQTHASTGKIISHLLEIFIWSLLNCYWLLVFNGKLRCIMALLFGFQYALCGLSSNLFFCDIGQFRREFFFSEFLKIPTHFFSSLSLVIVFIKITLILSLLVVTFLVVFCLIWFTIRWGEIVGFETLTCLETVSWC